MVEVIHDCLFQRVNTSKDAPANALLGDLGKEALDLINPRGTRWREMDMPVGMLQEPRFNAWRFVGRVVVYDDVYLLIQRQLIGDGVEELDKLLMAMPTMTLADDFSGGYVQGGEQRSGAMANIIVCMLLGLMGR